MGVDRDKLLELAARVEAHSPDDTEAGYALGREVIEAAADGGMAFWTLASPLYSLDAARSLVPEGFDWATGSVDHITGGPWAWVLSSCAEWNDDSNTTAATEELALTAAALRARAGGAQ